MSDFENLMLFKGARQSAGRYTEIHGLVTSYDPKKHRAKVMLMPHEMESDWMPVEVGHSGAGFGNVTGLTPGDGSSTGDQVICRPQGGDLEAMKIVMRVHSDSDNPPEAKSGEHVHHSQFGQREMRDKDGQTTIETGNVPQASSPQPGMTNDQVSQMNNMKRKKTKHFFDKDGNAIITTDGRHDITAENTPKSRGARHAPN